MSGHRRVAASAAVIVGLAVLPACAGARVAPAAAAPALHLRVLATHDFHGALRPAAYAWSDGRPIGGAAAVKGLMDRLEAACACPTVRLDGGDQMQGTLESNLVRGASVVAAFNEMGLDAAAVGNHELDWGVDTLIARQREARYAWLAANVVRRDNGARPGWATPYAVIERHGVRVGVVGYATVSTPRTLRADVTRAYEFRPGYAGIRDALDAVSRERPDFVVVVAHAGGGCTAQGPAASRGAEREGGCSGEMVDLAAELPRGAVQLIVGGHDHSAGEGVVNDIPIVRAGSDGRGVAVVDLHRRPDGSRTFVLGRETVYAGEPGDDPEMEALLAPYAARADAIGLAPVATLAEPLSASRTGDRRLGHFIAETVRTRAAADVGLHNPGGVRADLPQGIVSYADLHRVMPFDNTVVRLTLTGRQLRELVERAGPLYYFANLRIGYDPGAAAGSRVRSMAFGDGRPVADDERYALATSDFLADGGDGLDLLPGLPRTPLGITTLDAVVERLRAMSGPVSLPAVTSAADVEAAVR
jgi:5'-nucleotidase